MPSPTYAENLRIEVLVQANPKREGTATHKRWALYRSGMTVGEFLDAARKDEGDRSPRHKYLADVRWDADHGFIAVHTQDTVDQLVAKAESAGEDTTVWQQFAPAEVVAVAAPAPKKARAKAKTEA